MIWFEIQGRWCDDNYNLSVFGTTGGGVTTYLVLFNLKLNIFSRKELSLKITTTKKRIYYNQKKVNYFIITSLAFVT